MDGMDKIEKTCEERTEVLECRICAVSTMRQTRMVVGVGRYMNQIRLGHALNFHVSDLNFSWNGRSNRGDVL